MDFRHLHYFTEVVRTGSIKKASGRLFVSQPSISRQIQGMEEDIGVELLTRTAKGVVPTDAGRQFFNYAQSVLTQFEELKAKLRSESLTPSGPVALGLPPTLSSVVSVLIQERVMEEAPQVSLQIVESPSGFIRDWVYSGRLDLGILYVTTGSTGLVLEPFIAENLYVVSLPEGWGTDGEGRKLYVPRETVPFRQLSAYKFVLPAKPHGLRVLIESAARDNDIRITTSVEIDPLELIKTMVKRGHGLTILPQGAVHREIARGELVASRIVGPELTRTAYFASLAERSLPYSVLAVKEIMRKCADAISGPANWTCVFR